MKHSGKWQVGLEIKLNQLWVVACQYHRRVWRLRLLDSFIFAQHWSWENDEFTLHEWLPLLNVLGKKIPKNHSLRICLPPDLVFSHQLRLPNKLNSRAVLYNYIQAAIIQLFPNTAQTLVADFCLVDSNMPYVQLTLVRKSTVLKLTQLFTKANLYLDVIDLMPCALLPLFRMAELGPNSLLLYEATLFWCWAYQSEQGLQAGWAHRSNFANPAQCCLRLTEIEPHQRWFFSESNQMAPVDFMPFNPLADLWKNSLEYMPVEPTSSYFIACGLALREEDRLCNRLI